MLRYAARHHRKLLATGAAASTGLVAINYAFWPTDDDEGEEAEKNSQIVPQRRNFSQLDGATAAAAAATGFISNDGPLALSTSSYSKPIPTRAEQVNRLSSGEVFDVLVVGAGATGSGAALDAASRGLTTALIERGDFGNETSSRSTKLIWAGIRYIGTAVAGLLRFRNFLRPIDALDDFWGELKMVLGAHKERRLLLENNPHLTNWVPIAVPFHSWVSYPAPFGHPIMSTAPIVMPLVFKFYDGMSGFTCPPSHIMGKKRAMRKFPQIDEGAKYYSIFYEGQHNDSRTAQCIALTAAEEGACVSNYVEMLSLLKDDNGKATGVRCRDNLTGKEFDVHARSVVFAGGPFTDSLRKLEDPNAKPAVAAAAGTHIVLPGYYSPSGIGMLDINTSDGRFLFFLPWLGSTIIGTTDRKGQAVSSHGPPEEEIEWLLKEVQKYLSDDVKVRRADVLSAWQGWRPLASDPNAPPGAPVSRDHIISTNPDTGVTFITGGKWTTYREMAEDVIDRIIDLHGLEDKVQGPSRTDKIPLRGGVGYTRNVPIKLVQEYGVGEDVAKHLARTYGMNAFDVCKLAKPTEKGWPRFGKSLVEGYPFLECEIEYACKNEMACTVSDMLLFRMRLAYLNKEAAMLAAPRIADVMAKSMGWTRKERDRQLKDAQDVIASFGGPIPNALTAKSKLDATVKDARALFKTFDLAGNGYIDLQEMKLCVKMLGFEFKSDAEALKTFKSIDTNSDGKIAEKEFITWWTDESILKRSALKANLSARFKFSADKAPGTGAAFG